MQMKSLHTENPRFPWQRQSSKGEAGLRECHKVLLMDSRLIFLPFLAFFAVTQFWSLGGLLDFLTLSQDRGPGQKSCPEKL